MTNKEMAQNIYDMMGQGQLLEAFDKYYADNVEMSEIGEEPRIGKAVCRGYEEAFVGSIEEVHGMGIDSIASDDANNKVLVESWFEATLKGAGRIKMTQVAAQTWQDGQIIKEVFYHK